MYKTFHKKSSAAPLGFSLAEMMVVIVIVAVLTMIAAPALFSIMPSFQLRRAASATSGLMYLGRMTAFNIKKPTRAVINCKTANSPCQLSLYAAVFDNDGALDSWSELSNTSRQLDARVKVSADTPNTKVSGSPNDVYWAVFLPTGQVIPSHSPFNILLDTDSFNSGSWEVSLNLSSGHVSVER